MLRISEGGFPGEDLFVYRKVKMSGDLALTLKHLWGGIYLEVSCLKILLDIL